MLGRLPSYLLSDVRELIRHLDGPSFRKGLLTARLNAVNLPSLSSEDAQAFGVAVGRRTVRQTFLVRIEGVEPAIEYPERYRAAYRTGLVYGLLSVNKAPCAPKRPLCRLWSTCSWSTTNWRSCSTR